MSTSFTELLFLIHVFGLIGLILFDLFLVFNFKRLNIQVGILSFIAFIMLWFLGLIVVMTDYTMIYSIIFKFSTLLFALNGFFFIALLLFNLKNSYTSKEINPYSPEK